MPQQQPSVQHESRFLPDESGADSERGNESGIAVAQESSRMLKHRYFHDQIRINKKKKKSKSNQGFFTTIGSQQTAHNRIVDEFRIPASPRSHLTDREINGEMGICM